MNYNKEFLEVMKEHGKLAKDFGISETELQNIIFTFSQPASKDIDEITSEFLEKLNNKSK